MNSSALWVVIGLIVIAGLGWWVYSTQMPAAAPGTNVQVNTPASATPGAPAQGGAGAGASAGAGAGIGVGDASASVVYTASGFSPAEITVKKGTRVTWINQGGEGMWVASAQHPTHTTYSGTTLAAHCDDATDISFDQCQNGGTYSFTLDKVGTWGYHNHSNASHFGRVVVTE